MTSTQKNQMAPYVSGGLVIVNIILFLLCTFGDNLLYNKGGLSPYYFFSEKEYYRIFTSMFLHGDMEHLVNNMLLLFGLGAMIEKEVGHISFGVLYFMTGLGGNVTSLLYKLLLGEWTVVSIGASGAVFGLIGVLLVLTLMPNVKIPNATPVRILLVIGYSIYCGINETNIDNAAHIGGVLCGVLFSVLWFGVFHKRLYRREEQQSQEIKDGGYYED